MLRRLEDIEDTQHTAERDRLVKAVVPHVVFDGWTVTALHRGAEDIGMSRADAERLFPDAGRDLISWQSRMADREMLERLAETDMKSMKIRDRIKTAVRARLEPYTQEREAVRRAVAFLSLPQNHLLATRLLYHTVDDMWFAAGDTATDWNFYSKRALLAGVFTSTVMCWLDDHSEGCADSWSFLDRRVENVLQIPKYTGKLKKLVGFLPHRASVLRSYRARGRASR